MSKNRRDFFRRVGSVSAGLVVGAQGSHAQQNPHGSHAHHQHHGSQAAAPKPSSGPNVSPTGEGVLPIETPDVPRLPWKMVDGTKEFHLVAEPVETEFVPGRTVHAWGYNGSVPGPT